MAPKPNAVKPVAMKPTKKAGGSAAATKAAPAGKHEAMATKLTAAEDGDGPGSQWTVHEGRNCYDGHGGTNHDLRGENKVPRIMSVREAQEECRRHGHKGFTYEREKGRAWFLGSVDNPGEFRVSPKYDVYEWAGSEGPASQWTVHKGRNCYDGHGGTNHDLRGDNRSPRIMSVQEAQEECRRNGHKGFTYEQERGRAWFLSSVDNPGEFSVSPKYDVYEWAATGTGGQQEDLQAHRAVVAITWNAAAYDGYWKHKVDPKKFFRKAGECDIFLLQEADRATRGGTGGRHEGLSPRRCCSDRYNGERFQSQGDARTAKLSGGKGRDGIAMAQKFSDKVSKKVFRVVNVHAGHNDKGSMRQALKELEHLVGKVGDADVKIIGGDFNEMTNVVGRDFVGFGYSDRKTHNMGANDKVGARGESVKSAKSVPLDYYGSDHLAVKLVAHI